MESSAPLSIIILLRSLMVLIPIVGIGYLIRDLRREERKKVSPTTPQQTKATPQQTKGRLTTGVILCVIGGAIGVWVITRFTTFAGKLHSWSPPFTEYEIITLVGLGVAAMFIIVGLILLTIGFTRKSTSSLTESSQEIDTSTPQQTISQEIIDDTANIPEQIEQLSKLKEQGIVSDAEFEEKKKELLTRM